MKRSSSLASAFFTSLIIVGAANAAEGYVTDTNGNVVKSGSGLCWKTGSWTPAAATAECDPGLAPKPKAAERPAVLASSQPPATVSAPAKPAPDSVTLAADTLFVPGKAVLTRKGKAQLNELAKGVMGRRVEEIGVVVHADRTGTKQGNQRLTQKRAEAVKAYLVSRKIDGHLVRAEGKGAAEPLTASDDCHGKKGRKLTACLGPDRRVEIRIVRLD